jgi:hypothetical protein
VEKDDSEVSVEPGYKLMTAGMSEENPNKD